MVDLKVCPECGVPDYITGEHLWLKNGDIVQTRDHRARLVADARSEEEFRSLLALRGLGNLKELKYSNNGLRMRLENAALPLMIVGMMPGVLETFVGEVSTVEWEFSEDGNLEIEVSQIIW